MTDIIETTCLGRQVRYRPLRITTPDGVTLAAQDWERTTSGRDILFIHGFSQSHLAWLKQVTGPLVDEFRIVTYDIRGHGLSDNPTDASFYREPHRWADEVHTIIKAAGLARPVVVAWSYSGRVILDYLASYGDSSLSGLVMVSATSKADPSVLGPGAPVLRRMGSEDLGASLEATRELLTMCTPMPLPSDEFALMMGYNAMTPPAVRRALAGRPAEYDDVLRRLEIPVLTVHGDADQINLTAMSEHTEGLVQNCHSVIYQNVGHLPFWEDSSRFDADIANFVRSLQ